MTETPEKPELDLTWLVSRMDASKLDLVLVEGLDVYKRQVLAFNGDVQVEPFSSLKKSGVDKLRQKLDSWFNEIPPQEAVEDAE